MKIAIVMFALCFSCKLSLARPPLTYACPDPDCKKGSHIPGSNSVRIPPHLKQTELDVAMEKKRATPEQIKSMETDIIAGVELLDKFKSNSGLYAALSLARFSTPVIGAVFAIKNLNPTVMGSHPLESPPSKEELKRIQEYIEVDMKIEIDKKESAGGVPRVPISSKKLTQDETNLITIAAKHSVEASDVMRQLLIHGRYDAEIPFSPNALAEISKTFGSYKPHIANFCIVEDNACPVPAGPEGSKCYCPSPVLGWVFLGTAHVKEAGIMCKAAFNTCQMTEPGIVGSICLCPMNQPYLQGPDVGRIQKQPLPIF